MNDSMAKGQLMTPKPVQTGAKPSFKPPPQVESNAKRHIACSFCRRRKLKCNGEKPLCSSCVKFKQCDCHYELKVKKSGPKKGYVKQLEERLSMIEGMLSRTGNSSLVDDISSKPTGDTDCSSDCSNGNEQDGEPQGDMIQEYFNKVPTKGLSSSFKPANLPPRSSSATNSSTSLYDDINQSHDESITSYSTGKSNLPGSSSATSDSFSSDFSGLIELNIEEAMPQPELMDVLIDHYFSAIYSLYPFIHRNTFLGEMAQPFNLRPPVYFQYAILAVSASGHDKYHDFAEVFYLRAKKYLEKDELHGVGERIVDLRYVQACVLLFEYEKKMGALSRCWITCAKACRAAMLLNIHVLDSKDTTVYNHLPYYRKEEMRRTFWVSFSMDRYMSTGNPWPMIYPESDIDTDLPGSLIAFEQNIFEKGCVFSKALKDPDYLFSHKFSSFSFYLLIAVIIGKTQQLVHKKCTKEDYKMDGNWWKEFLEIDSHLSSIILALPKLSEMSEHSPEFKSFLQVCIMSQSTIVYLYQWSLSKMKQLDIINEKLLVEFHSRCLLGSNEVLRLIREYSTSVDYTNSSVTIFSLYVSASAYVSTLKALPFHREFRLQLDFIVTLLRVLSEKVVFANCFYNKVIVLLAELKEVVENFSPNDVKIYDIDCSQDKILDDLPMASLVAKFYKNIPKNFFNCQPTFKGAPLKQKFGSGSKTSANRGILFEFCKSSPPVSPNDVSINSKSEGGLERGNASVQHDIPDQSLSSDPSFMQSGTTLYKDFSSVGSSEAESRENLDIRMTGQPFNTNSAASSNMMPPVITTPSRSSTDSSIHNVPNTQKHSPVYGNRGPADSFLPANNSGFVSSNRTGGSYTSSINQGVDLRLDQSVFNPNLIPAAGISIGQDSIGGGTSSMFGCDLDPMLQNLTPRAIPHMDAEWNWNSEMTLNRLMTDIMSDDFSSAPL